MPFTLSDGNVKVTALTTKPADVAAVTTTELTAGTDIQDYVLKSDFRLSPIASDTVTDTPLGQAGTATSFGPSNYEGTVTIFRDLDASTGLPVTAGEDVWDLFKEKGTQLWLVLREGPSSDTAWASGQEYEIYEVLTDTPQHPTDRAGYVKRTVTLGVQNASLYNTVAV